ncbi:uncharacterized protein C5orf52 homolog [Mesocricetus auratus]|uniref:Uncharacterized protein C5orf52 homolog n=1 Tax=Mesocricetus auratus TaxID=10036 RepID=A0ABM2XII3_MESAU|nr:uncharacterized protein C5orf52 homolog [Mesocricetus auratus]
MANEAFDIVDLSPVQRLLLAQPLGLGVSRGPFCTGTQPRRTRAVTRPPGKRGGLQHSLPARLHGNEPRRASRRSRKDRHQIGRRLPTSVQTVSSVSALPSFKAFRFSYHSESFSALADSSSQPRKPSVKWDLGSNFESVAKETAAPSSDFRRERLDSQPDLGVRVQPQTLFLRPRPAISKLLFSIINSSDANVKKLLPKSHLPRVIIRDNLNAQRIYEMEMKASDKTKRKMSHLYDHLKKKFMTDQLRKMLRWRRESLNTQQYLDRQRFFRHST